ncbi:hypothetical protein MRX96_047024 [Rhipicephalus microplus]
MAVNNAAGLSNVPRRDFLSTRLGCMTGEIEASPRASNNQEAIDADENRVTAETATTAMTHIPREGELMANMAAITQSNLRLAIRMPDSKLSRVSVTRCR